MNNSLKRQIDKLETQRNSLLRMISHLSNQQLNAHPEGKWSIAQVLSHLISSEQLSVRYLNKKMLGVHEAPESGFREAFIMTLLMISQRLPLKFKAPTVLVENTITYQTTDQIIDAWEKVRSELKETVGRFQNDQLKRKVYKHPIAGMLNIKQALQFFREHITHHTPQVRKLLGQK